MARSLKLFLRDHDVLYHLTDEQNVHGIHTHGFLSARYILKNNLVTCNALNKHRPESIPIDTKDFGRIIVRDQKPMPPHILEGTLPKELKAEDWYEVINSKIFFWVSEKPAKTLAAAYLRRGAPQSIIRVSTVKLLAKYEANAFVSPINSGAVDPRNNKMRDLSIFQPFSVWLTQGFSNIGRKTPSRVKEFVLQLDRADLADAILPDEGKNA